MRTSGVVSVDTTYTLACSPYELPSGGIDLVNGATLTIEPGVEVRFRDGDWLEIGATGRPGRLVARGTPERPIVFSSADPQHLERSWLGLWFHSGTLPGSVVSHAIIRQAGGPNAFIKPPLEQGCLTFTGVKPGVVALSDVELSQCDNGAVRLNDSHPRIERIKTTATKLGIVADVDSFGSVVDTLASDAPLEHHVTAGRLNVDATWAAQAAPVSVDGDVTVAGPAEPTLTLAPGLTLRFQKGATLRIGEDAAGTLLAHGTKQARIALTALAADAPWCGIVLGAHASDKTTLDGVDLSSAKETLDDNRPNAPRRAKRRVPCR